MLNYLQTKFHMPGTSDSLVMKPKAKYRFHAVAMFYIFLWNYFNKSFIFLKDLLTLALAFVLFPPHMFVGLNRQ
jgi:hypothetical protein